MNSHYNYEMSTSSERLSHQETPYLIIQRLVNVYILLLKHLLGLIRQNLKCFSQLYITAVDWAGLTQQINVSKAVLF